MAFTLLINLLYTVFLVTLLSATLLVVLESAGGAISLLISSLSTSAFKLAKSDFAAKYKLSMCPGEIRLGDLPGQRICRKCFPGPTLRLPGH